MLYLVGWGLYDLTVEGLKVLQSAERVYLESYTGLADIQKLKKQIKKEVIALSREDVEQNPYFLQQAKKDAVAIVITGDPLAATTHIDLLIRAKEEGIKTRIIHNASVFTAVSETGLQLYKFGKTVSIPHPQKNYLVETPYNILKENQSIGAHTLLLLDVAPFMTVNDAINILLKIELKRNEKVFTRDTFCVGCAGLGSDSVIKAGKASGLLKESFGSPVHCLIVPSKLHFMEEEFLKQYS